MRYNKYLILRLLYELGQLLRVPLPPQRRLLLAHLLVRTSQSQHQKQITGTLYKRDECMKTVMLSCCNCVVV
jgi:hypothetical protein